MRIVCLANSYRVGGRCLGGIELDQFNRPVFKNGRPRWVRPVCNTAHEEVPNELVAHISLLDIIEFEPIRATGNGHQSENILFRTNTIRKIGQFPVDKLGNLTDNDRYDSLFGNRGKAVPEHMLAGLSYSLMLVSLNNFEASEKIYEGKPYPQIRLLFNFKGKVYDLPITDPTFLHVYALNNDVLERTSKVFVTLSLAAPHEEWSSKLVAGIIYDDSSANKSSHSSFNSHPQPTSFSSGGGDDDDLPF